MARDENGMTDVMAVADAAVDAALSSMALTQLKALSCELSTSLLRLRADALFSAGELILTWYCLRLIRSRNMDGLNLSVELTGLGKARLRRISI